MAIINLNGLNVRTFRKVLDHATCKQTLTNVQERVLYKIITQRNMVSAGRIPEGARKAARDLYIEMEEKKALLPEISPARVKRWDQIQANIASLQRIESELFQPQKKLGETELLAMNDQLEQIVKVISSHRGLERMAGSIALEIGDRLAELSEREAIQARGEARRQAILASEVPLGHWTLVGDDAQTVAEIIAYLRQSNGSLTIGRSGQIKLAQPDVSARHAEIGFDGRAFWLKDLGSSNGTYLRGKRVKPQIVNELAIGEFVYLGSYCFVFFEKLAPLDMRGIPLPPEPTIRPVVSGGARDMQGELSLSPSVIRLRDDIRGSGQQLLFTRNIDLNELTDAITQGTLRPHGRRGYIKYFRYGLGHEYAEIVMVMKPGFWETEKERSRLGNLFLEEYKGQPLVKKQCLFHRYPQRARVLAIFGTDQRWQSLFNNPNEKFLTPKPDIFDLLNELPIGGAVKAALIELLHESPIEIFKRLDKKVDLPKLLRDLATGIEYNRLLGQMAPRNNCAGRTVLVSDIEKLMSYFPQLEVDHEVPLDQVEAILVPEHLWAQVTELAKEHNPKMLDLFRQVKGSGQTRALFTDGRERLARRSSSFGGSFEPVFGDAAFFLFEQAYFRTMAAAYHLTETTRTTSLTSNSTLANFIAFDKDADFRAELQFDEFSAAIPKYNPLRQLVGLAQNPSHGGYDPLQHTFNALHLLDTDGLANQGIGIREGFDRPVRELLRIAMLYHDIGKVRYPYDPKHAEESGKMAEEILKNPEVSGVGKLTNEERDFVLTLIRTHHLFGDFNKYNVDIPTAIAHVGNELKGPFSLSEMFYFHLLIATADINSIPGVRVRVVPEKWNKYIDAVYNALGEE